MGCSPLAHFILSGLLGRLLCCILFLVHIRTDRFRNATDVFTWVAGSSCSSLFSALTAAEPLTPPFQVWLLGSVAGRHGPARAGSLPAGPGSGPGTGKGRVGPLSGPKTLGGACRAGQRLVPARGLSVQAVAEAVQGFGLRPHRSHPSGSPFALSWCLQGCCSICLRGPLGVLRRASALFFAPSSVLAKTGSGP